MGETLGSMCDGGNHCQRSLVELVDDPNMARSCSSVNAVFNSISNLKLINYYILNVNFFSKHLLYNNLKNINNNYLGHFVNNGLKSEVYILVVGFLVWPKQQIYNKYHGQ